MSGQRLTDEQYRSFFANGFLQLRPETMSDDDHRFLHRRAEELYRISSAIDNPRAHLQTLGDNVRAQVPEIDRLLVDPVIDGALTDLLGPDYLVHPHSFCHISSDRDQLFHQDGNLPWNERAHYRSHRPEWAILFYYPQDVHPGNGPTEIVPGSHFLTVDHEIDERRFYPGDRVDREVDDAIFKGSDLERRDRHQALALERGLPVPGLQRRFLEVPAGTAILAHYDLFHRGSRVSTSTTRRYMYKFNLVRCHEPTMVRPGWTKSRTPAATPEQHDLPIPSLAPVVAANMAWTAGRDRNEADLLPARPDGPAADPDRAGDLDRTGGPDRAGDVDRAADPDRAADLDRTGDPGAGSDRELAELSEDLVSGGQDRQLAAAYRLGALGRRQPLALVPLQQALEGATEAGRRAAAHGLRQAGAAGLPMLLAALGHHRAGTRRAAAAGLGSAATAGSEAAVTALVSAMGDDPDDLVRSNAAYSLGHVVRALATEVPTSEVPASEGPASVLPEGRAPSASQQLVTAIVDGLLARLAPGAEPDNAFSASFSRSTVRQSVGYALALALANHALHEDQIDAVVDGPLRDVDRYIQGLVVEGLARTGNLPASARRRMVDHLAGRRWNALAEPAPDETVPPAV